ncbi:MAG: DUF624 domain-containing protein [Firmicutes bacterium]|nr:DUF624 domain-containing protein [Bacillota bacterium]
MGGFFSTDGLFYKIGTLIADVCILGLVWLFFSIPLFTIGASTTALYYVVTRRISDREGYLVRDFWKSFRQNFKKSTLVWLITLVLIYVIYINIRNISLLGSLSVVFFPFQILILIEIAFVTLYVYAIIARFEMSFKETLKTAFFMSNKHLFSSLLAVIWAFAVVILVYLFPPLFLFAMGLFAYAHAYLIMRIFRKYRPEIDREQNPEDEDDPLPKKRGLFSRPDNRRR